MKKFFISLSVFLICILIKEIPVEALTAKNYLPDNKLTYYYKEKGFDVAAYTNINKSIFKNGYWRDYHYNSYTEKYEKDDAKKSKYIIKKDGIYVQGMDHMYIDYYTFTNKILPINFKKGGIYKTIYKSSYDKSNFEISQSLDKIISISEKVKIGNKTYRDVVKIKKDINFKELEIYIYYAKDLGVIKMTADNHKKGYQKYAYVKVLYKTRPNK